MDWPRAPSGSTCLGDGTVCGCVDALQFEQNTIRSVHRFCITPLQKLAYDRHPSSCHHSRVSRSTTGADWAMLTPPLGRRGALRLGRPYESPAQGSLTRSRSSPSPGQCLPFSETVSPPILPSPSVSQTRPLRRGDYVLRPKQCLKAETQNVPIGVGSSPLHLRSVVAFHGTR